MRAIVTEAVLADLMAHRIPLRIIDLGQDVMALRPDEALVELPRSLGLCHPHYKTASRFMPHQGAKECARRQRQMAKQAQKVSL